MDRTRLPSALALAVLFASGALAGILPGTTAQPADEAPAEQAPLPGQGPASVPDPLTASGVQGVWAAVPTRRAHMDGQEYPFLELIRVDTLGLTPEDLSAAGLPLVPLPGTTVPDNDEILDE